MESTVCFPCSFLEMCYSTASSVHSGCGVDTNSCLLLMETTRCTWAFVSFMKPCWHKALNNSLFLMLTCCTYISNPDYFWSKSRWPRVPPACTELKTIVILCALKDVGETQVQNKNQSVESKLSLYSLTPFEMHRVFQEWQELQQEASKPLQITDRKEQNNKVKQDVQLPLYSSSTVVSLSCWRYWNEGVRRCHPAECFYSESPSHACHSCFKGHVVSCAFRAALFRSHSVDHPIHDFLFSPCRAESLNTITTIDPHLWGE